MFAGMLREGIPDGMVTGGMPDGMRGAAGRAQDGTPLGRLFTSGADDCELLPRLVLSFVHTGAAGGFAQAGAVGV